MTYNDKNPAVDGSDKQRDSLQGRLDKLLGAVQVKAGREGIFYSGVVVPEDLPQMMTIIRDSVVGTCITAADLSETEAIAEYEVAELIGKPDLLLPELTHTTAFYGTQYHGEHKSIDEIVHPNSILSVPQGLKTLDAGNINKFWRRSLQADDTTAIAVGAGISLKDFMHQCGNHISEIFKPSSPSSILTGSTGNYDHLDTSNTNHVELEYQKNNDFTSTSKATPKQLKYIGGTAYYEIAEEHLLHISIAFNGLPATASTKDTIAFATLQMLLGGGNAFSAGGPGKGMYSRLYQRVLNRHHWIESCRVFAHSYASCGLFGIHASAPPSHARDLAKVVVAQIRDSAEGPMSIEEVDRARNQVKSAVLMGLESRVAQVEQLAEQVAFNQEYLTPAQICERVDAIKAVDLQEAAQKMIQSNPTIIAYGPIQALPSQDVIRKWLL